MSRITQLFQEMQDSTRAASSALDDLQAHLAELERLLDNGRPQVTQYSQNDPRWANQVYAGGYTFGQAGCYVVAVAMVASLAGYISTPPAIASLMRNAGCFNGAMLSYPQKIPVALPALEWPTGAYYNRPGNEMPHDELDLIRLFIDQYGAMILKVDYKPENYLFNMHFVLAVDYSPDDFVIVDPLDGARRSLLAVYGASRGWGQKQSIFGYRALRVK